MKPTIPTYRWSSRRNPAVAQHLSQRFSGTVETMQLETGDTADYRASANGMEVEILREDETVLAAMYESWEPLAAALRALYQQELDGFSHEPAEPEEQLAEEQPDFGKGFTVCNLRAMRQFYCLFPIRHTLCAEMYIFNLLHTVE